MSDYDQTIAASIYAASNIYSWTQAMRVPSEQADANRSVLSHQKTLNDQLIAEQRNIISNAINQYLNSIDNLLVGTEFEEAFPDVPQAAEFEPISDTAIQSDTISKNLSKIEDAVAYVREINRTNEQNDLIHILSMDPRFLVTLDIQSASIQDLTRGNLPVGDVVEVLTDNAEQASLTGRIGNTRKTTARDLGVSKLRAQAAGRKEFRDATAWANSAVSPITKQHDASEMMLTPIQRIELALTQSQLIQQSLQNVYNQASLKEPYKMAKLQTKIQKIITRLEKKASEALLQNTFIPGASLGGSGGYGVNTEQMIKGVTGLLGAIGQDIAPAQKSWFLGGPGQVQGGSRVSDSQQTVRADQLNIPVPVNE